MARWLSGARPMACVIGLLAYLLLPALHAWHAEDGAPSWRTASHASHAHGDHASGADQRPDRESGPTHHHPHDAASCDLCQVFCAIAKHVGFSDGAPVVSARPVIIEVRAVESRVIPVCRDLASAPPRGPPTIV